VGRRLWREDGSVFCIWCWSSPAQSFSGPSPLDLATIFYCLSFETSLFVASYDSQGNGGGIRLRLHTGYPLSLFVASYHPLDSPSTDFTENVSSIIARYFVAGEATCPHSCYLPMDLHFHIHTILPSSVFPNATAMTQWHDLHRWCMRLNLNERSLDRLLVDTEEKQTRLHNVSISGDAL
jgi:hypothetical protein